LCITIKTITAETNQINLSLYCNKVSSLTTEKVQIYNNIERKIMSENSPTTKTFQQRADEFIAVANQQAAESGVDEVNTSILYSAARFNAFSVARSVESAENLQAEKQHAIEYFTQRYAEMLAQNLDEYISRFEDYTQK
jgi:hypothetical protein